MFNRTLSSIKADLSACINAMMDDQGANKKKITSYKHKVKRPKPPSRVQTLR